MGEAGEQSMPQIDQGGAAPARDITVRRPGMAPITIRVFPADPRFAADVRSVVGELPLSDDEEAGRRRLESLLQRWYPRTRVHERTEIGAPLLSERLWYVLRDGGVRPREPRTERLLSALATARDVTADAEARLERARETVKSGVGLGSRRPDRDDPGEVGADD
jgi:chromosome segregation ATPase